MAIQNWPTTAGSGTRNSTIGPPLETSQTVLRYKFASLVPLNAIAPFFFNAPGFAYPSPTACALQSERRSLDANTGGPKSGRGPDRANW